VKELNEIRERDKAAAETWFKGPASFTAQAARDRRALLAMLEPRAIPAHIADLIDRLRKAAPFASNPTIMRQTADALEELSLCVDDRNLTIVALTEERDMLRSQARVRAKANEDVSSAVNKNIEALARDAGRYREALIEVRALVVNAVRWIENGCDPTQVPRENYSIAGRIDAALAPAKELGGGDH